MLMELIDRGMSIARLNLAHCTHKFAVQVITDVRAYSKASNIQVAIWLDINGPKVRSGRLAGGKPVKLTKGLLANKGSEFQFVNDVNLLGDATQVATTYTKELVHKGDVICVDDGMLSFVVVDRLDNSIKTIVETSGILGENKGITFPHNVIRDLPAISAQDKQDVAFAIEHKIDFISVSSLRDTEDVKELRLLLGNSPIKMFAKIENKRGMDNFESVLSISDGVVLDRGYLGSEVDLELVVIGQKRMIAQVTEINTGEYGRQTYFCCKPDFRIDGDTSPPNTL